MKLLIVVLLLLSCFSNRFIVCNLFLRPFSEVYDNNGGHEIYIDQKLDHFDVNNTREWKQRVFEWNEFYSPGGPVIVYIHGFDSLEGGVNFDEVSIFRELLVEYKCLMYAIENRFFGNSIPTKDLSFDYLKYLTVEQSMADYAEIIRGIRMAARNAGSPKLFLIGHNTGGSLATWTMAQFPELADLVWVSSAPLEIKSQLQYYYDIGVTVKNYGGEQCYNNFENKFNELQHTMRGRLVYNDYIFFISNLAHRFARHIEYGDSNTIETLCARLETVHDIDSLIHFIARGEQLATNYSAMIDTLRNPSWDFHTELSHRQKLYLRCNEIPFFEVSTQLPNPFGAAITLDSYTQLCCDVFTAKYSDDYVERQAQIVNLRYGGVNPNVKYAYFTHGELDPYRHVGRFIDLNADSPADLIPYYGKSGDMRQRRNSDGNEINKVRQRIKGLFKEMVDY